MDSVSHGVKDHIDGERVSDLFGEVLEIKMVVAFPLPSVTIVGVVRGKAHNAAFIVKDDSMMRNSAPLF